jgi:hypothetical protein
MTTDDKSTIDKTIAHINWLMDMNTQVRLMNPKPRHEGYEMALNDVLRFIRTVKETK